MARFQIGHPEIPQLSGILTLPEGQVPTERDFWAAAKSVIRPYGLTQLSPEAKISAYKNGFFEGGLDISVFDQEDDPETEQDEAQPGVLSTIGEFVQEFGRRADPFISPYNKVVKLDEEPVPYKDVENLEQFRQAGKVLFGLLDNREKLEDLGDPIGAALAQAGMPYYKNNANARGRAKAAAMDYATDNIKSSIGMGLVRGAKTSQFIGAGAEYLTNRVMGGDIDDDDDDILDYVDSAIAFDKVNYEYENAAELAAFILENPIESAKGLAAIESANYNLDSQLQQDIRSGFQQPSEGLGFFAEVVGDPLNLGMASTAKAVTAPQRIALSGKIKKTLQETQRLTAQQARLKAMSQKLPAESLVQPRLAKNFESLQSQLAAKQQILNKYGRDSLAMRLIGKSSPQTLGKVARESVDISAPGGKKALGMALDAASPSSKAGLVRPVAKAAAKLTPEILGATAGAALFGAPGAAVGATLPALTKGLRFLANIPSDSALRYIITGARNAGEEITEVEARRRLNSLKYKIAGTLAITGTGGFIMDQDALGIGATGGLLATIFGPNTLKVMDNAARDARVIGTEFIAAQTQEPFFRRIALLPNPEEGLQGALRDRHNLMTGPGPENMIVRGADALVTGTKAAAREVSTPNIPFRTTRQGEAIGKAKVASKAVTGTAEFLDRTGLGRYAETAGRFVENFTKASTLPASLGFVAAAGEPAGAVSGVAMAAPFTAIGTGAGMYQNYKSKGDLYQKMIGDEQYYRDHLTAPEKAEFDQMPASLRMVLAGYSLSHPDVVFTASDRGAGSFNPTTMEITYNPNQPGTLIRGTMAHEISHFVEVHGLRPVVNRILFGDPLTGLDGVFAKYDDKGNVTYSEEFYGGVDKDGKPVQGLRDIYLERLREDPTARPEDVARYEADPTLIGREIFADHGADYVLSGEREASLNRGPLGKLLFATLEGMMSVNFLRDFAMKIHQPLNARGDVIKSSDLFKGKLKRIPELDRLIDKYYKDTRGKRKSEIEGVEITDPATGRKTTHRGARPLDDDFDVVYTVEDQKNPIVQEILDTGGIYAKDDNGNIITDASGAPKGMTKGELKKIDKLAGDHASKVFERNGIDVETDPVTGEKFVKDINNIPEEVIDQLAEGPLQPRQIATLREVSRSLREGDGERAGLLLGYFAASQNRKPKAVPFKVRPTLPYGFELTKQGNFLIRLHERNQLLENLEFLKGHPQLPVELRGMYDDLFGSDNAVWEGFHNYRNNTAAGIDGKTGLDADPLIAEKKLNFLNALHGAISREQVARNPVLNAIGYQLASSNKKGSPFGAATKSFRLDRVFNATRSGQSSGFNLERIKALMSPEDQSLLIPMQEFDAPTLLRMIRENTEGFTLDMLGNVPQKGFIVAPRKDTEFVINQNELDLGQLKGYLERNADLFEREGAHIGGWRNPDTLDFMLDVSFPLSEKDAYRHALWGDQDAIFDIETFTEISTKNENQQPKLPKDFGETVEQVLKQRPSDLGAAAEIAFRESSPIREQSIESTRRRAEGLRGEARDSEATSGKKKDLGEELLSPARITRDSLILRDGTVIEAGRGKVPLNPQFPKEGGSRPDSHSEALFSWIEKNPDHPLAKKIGYKNQDEFFDRTDYDMMREAQQAGLLVRVKRGEGGKILIDGNPKELTSAQRAVIEQDATDANKAVFFESMFNQRQTKLFAPPGMDVDYFMPVLEDAKALVEEEGRVAISSEEEFFSKFLPKVFSKVGGQVKQSGRSIKLAAKRAAEDVIPFFRENPIFADYYNNDMKLVRKRLDDHFGGISDDDFVFYRLALGLTSPNTQLPANVGEAVGALNEYLQYGNLDRVIMSVSPKGNVVLKDTPFSIGGPPRGTKARTLKVVDRLAKEKGSVQKAADFLIEGVTRKEIDAFNKEMGYKGNVAEFSAIQRVVKQATGQDKLIPRMFIFGKKVGPYTLNALGKHEYNTFDVWEARFIRSYFKGMFDDRTGLPGPVDEHALMVRFTELFNEEFKAMTGEELETSALQATRWFYMIQTAKELGYTKANTDDTISGYTQRYLDQLEPNSRSGRSGDSSTREGVRSQTAQQAIAAAEKAGSQTGVAEAKKASDLGLLMPQGMRRNAPRRRPKTLPQSNRFLAPPAAAKAAVVGESLERFNR